MNVSFRGTAEPPGVAIVDPIEQRHFHVATSAPVSPRPADEDSFVFPVDTACRIGTDHLRLDSLYDVYVRSVDGSLLRTVRSHQEIDLDPDTYYLELCGPVKLYCRVTAAPTLRSGADYLHVDFGDVVDVLFGARSYHEHPAATITTTEDPEDMMTAVSAFSSALKTTSCERAYPTLRGHPPLVELGDELDVPGELSPAETGVRIVVPPTYRHVFTVASLAFYLGATVVPGETPRLVTDDGFEYDLAGQRWFEDEVARVLKRVVFLDCLVRTEGLYDVDLYERRAVADGLDLDFAEVYDKPLSGQVADYLRTPFEAVEDHLPTWCLTAHVGATAENVPALPFVVNDLGIVREPRGVHVRDPHERVTNQAHPSATDGGVTTGEHRSGADGDGRTLVEPSNLDESVEHVWFGDHVPRGASKATIEAFRNRLTTGERNEVIDITVVCNDEEMLDEQEDIDGIYGNRNDLPYDVSSYFAVETDELAGLLTESGCDFLHYIGHATPDGLECPDGDLDVRTLDEVDVRVFLLNACRSYDQALELTRRGAIGGVGTLGDVVNEYAVETGRAMANLLNMGFPLRGAVDLVREHTQIGDQYQVVGDGATDISQTDGGPPIVCGIENAADDEYDLELWTYPTRVYRMGSTATPTLDQASIQYLLPGEVPPIRLDRTALDDFLTWSSYPVRVDGELRWNDALQPVDVE